jgi:hypothetical protein
LDSDNFQWRTTTIFSLILKPCCIYNLAMSFIAQTNKIFMFLSNFLLPFSNISYDLESLHLHSFTAKSSLAGTYNRIINHFLKIYGINPHKFWCHWDEHICPLILLKYHSSSTFLFGSLPTFHRISIHTFEFDIDQRKFNSNHNLEDPISLLFRRRRKIKVLVKHASFKFVFPLFSCSVFDAFFHDIIEHLKETLLVHGIPAPFFQLLGCTSPSFLKVPLTVCLVSKGSDRTRAWVISRKLEERQHAINYSSVRIIRDLSNSFYFIWKYISNARWGIPKR